MMTTEEAFESARADSMGSILFQLDPNIRKRARRLEKIQIKIMKNKCSVLFNNTCLQNNLLPKYTTFKYNLCTKT